MKLTTFYHINIIFNSGSSPVIANIIVTGDLHSR
jgi:hypothetical protein